jgi:DTW domain-containing protein YfiP
MKNRSLPLLEMCFRQYLGKETNETESESNTTVKREEIIDGDEKQRESDWSMAVLVGRRLGDQTDPLLLTLLHQTSNVLLVFPFSYSNEKEQCEVLSLEDGIATLHQRQQEHERRSGNGQESQKITLVFIDATWKYAKEMVRVNDERQLWPTDSLVRVKLDPPSASSELASWDQNENGHDIVKGYVPPHYRPLRFAAIRTPPSVSTNNNNKTGDPSSDFLSTAECIAWVVSHVEESPELYNTLMNPLDAMVKQWQSFQSAKNYTP